MIIGVVVERVEQLGSLILKDEVLLKNLEDVLKL